MPRPSPVPGVSYRSILHVSIADGVIMNALNIGVRRFLVGFALSVVVVWAGMVIAESGPTASNTDAGSDSDPDLEFLVDVRAQPTSERSMRTMSFQRDFVLGSTQETTFYQPSHVHVDDDGTIYVMDFRRPGALSFSTAGTPKATFGAASGQGPGEFQQPTGFSVSSSGAVWISDASTSRLTEFAADGEVQSTVRLDAPPWRVTTLHNDRLIVRPASGSDDLLRHVDREGRVLNASSPLVADQTFFFPALAGHQKATEDHEHVIYVTRYAGLFFSFDADLNLKYARQLVDPPPFPDIRRDVLAGGTTVHGLYYDELDDVVHGFDVSGDEIHVLRRHGGMQPADFGIVDVYRLDDGTYLHSYDAPVRRASDIEVRRGRFHAVVDTVVAVWSMQSAR